MDSLLPPPENAGMPWSRLVEAGWSIVGMNHFRTGGKLYLYVAIMKDTQCLVSQGLNDSEIFKKLEVAAKLQPRSILPKKEAAPADPRHKQFIDAWGFAYTQHFQRKYVFQGAQDASQLARLLKQSELNVEQMISVARDAWHIADSAKFPGATKRASSIAGFCSGWNEINAELDRINSAPPQR